jgi:hypothetical protein
MLGIIVVRGVYLIIQRHIVFSDCYIICDFLSSRNAYIFIKRKRSKL